MSGYRSILERFERNALIGFRPQNGMQGRLTFS